MKSTLKTTSKITSLLIPTPLVVGFFVLALGVSAQAEIGESFILCKHNKVVRTLRIDGTSDACKAVYTKEGVDKVIGASQSKEVCTDVLDKVRKNLEEGSWACREVKESRLSNLGSDETH